jgi:serine/threonine protein kinase
MSMRPTSSMRKEATEKLDLSNMNDGIVDELDEGPSARAMREFQCQSLSLMMKTNKNRFNQKSNAVEPPKINVIQAVAQQEPTQEMPLELQWKKSADIKVDGRIFINLNHGKVTEEYEIEGLLGEGTYGRVVLAKHKKTNLKRALKIIQKKKGKATAQVLKTGEFEILKNLDHPNILRMFEMFSDDTHYYLVYEYCEGGELFDRIKKVKAFNEKIAANIFYQILLAVAYCHSRNITHRDLKPENILFMSKANEDQIKLIDFGVSVTFSKGTTLSDRQGTVRKRLKKVYYIAPEVLQKCYNEKCDVWSCGVILFIMLCGYPPFNGSTDATILSKIAEGKFEFRGSFGLRQSRSGARSPRRPRTSSASCSSTTRRSGQAQPRCCPTLGSSSTTRRKCSSTAASWTGSTPSR